ncbi:arginine-tRNA ligase [Artemisia annua]|uniref:arginine--tRNA ligase n=1 Tax=Artemisia annua TaxID=35608 RepID=A0A2U1PLB9_ARTAN|nr:arginine-tRNA ligase [Artemisia annua]
MDVLKQENDFERRKKRRDKVISRRAYSTSTKAASTSHSEGSAFDGIQKAKRWRLKEEIIKLFDDSIKHSFPEFEGEKPVICASHRPGRGDFNCQNVLSIWPKIRKSRDLRRKHVDIKRPRDVGEASELTLKRSKGWGTSEERVLELHLLQFTDKEGSSIYTCLGGHTIVFIAQKYKWVNMSSTKFVQKEMGYMKRTGYCSRKRLNALERSCLYVLPHILCEYIYGLSKKFTSFYSYYSSVRKIGSIVDTSTILLCEATAVVMEKCFHLLGITPEVSNPSKIPMLKSQSFAKRPIDVNVPVTVENQMRAKRKQKEAGRNLEGLFKDLFITRSVSVARDPPRNSRLELFSIIPSITTDSMFEFEELKLFGLIAVSDKYGLLPNEGSYFSKPDCAYVPLFNVDCCDAIDMRGSGVLYLGDPSCQHSVSFSSSIEVRMELTATTERKNVCFQLCNHKFKIDSSDIWEKEIDSKCDFVVVEGEDGRTKMHYILIRDAVDADLELRFNTKTPHEVCGFICAFYGCHPIHDSYTVLLFQSDLPFVLKHGRIPLERSMLAVPMNGSLVIEVELKDFKSGDVIFKGSRTFKSLREGTSHENIKAIETEIECSLDMKVHWKYKA